MSTNQGMANLDTDTSHSSIPSREQRGRVYDRPTGGTKNNMAMIIGLILAAIAVVILLALLF